MYNCKSDDKKISNTGAGGENGFILKKLNTEELTKHITKAIQETMRLEIKNWLSIQLDRTATNRALINNVKGTINEANPAMNFCAAHGINNAGKKLQYPTKYAENFQSYGKV